MVKYRGVATHWYFYLTHEICRFLRKRRLTLSSTFIYREPGIDRDRLPESLFESEKEDEGEILVGAQRNRSAANSFRVGFMTSHWEYREFL